jgi:hypothetical protein
VDEERAADRFRTDFDGKRILIGSNTGFAPARSTIFPRYSHWMIEVLKKSPAEVQDRALALSMHPTGPRRLVS